MMTKMSQLEANAMQEAFNEEFIKLAQGASILKLLLQGTKWVGKTFKHSGKLERFSEKGLSLLKNGKRTPEFNEFMRGAGEHRFIKGSDGAFKIIGGGDSGFLGSRIADSYNYARALGKGVKNQKGFFAKAKQGLKNFGGEEIQQYRNQTYRVVDTNKPAMFGKSKHVIENGNLKGQAFMPDRKVIQDLGEGKYLVKKRLPMRALGYGMTPTGMVASGLALGDSTGNSVMEAAKWTPATKLFGELSMAGSAVSSIFK